ncbi:hypothetical protein DFR75_10797 [Nocardia ignorata]|uniref:Alpha/beta hydrolase family protein n=1 Tax=Nocardia ignorata TaxID=145285 RepID=A0A4V3CMX1_NOCIG|nr:hypothetical protein DFR75_10797 [Nocardia ignorata]
MRARATRSTDRRVLPHGPQLRKIPSEPESVVSNYRWRLSLAPGEPQYDAYGQQLATGPVITVPTITPGQRLRGPTKDGMRYRAEFTGRYEHRVLDGIGHNVSQEAPRPFAQAIINADHL